MRIRNRLRHKVLFHILLGGGLAACAPTDPTSAPQELEPIDVPVVVEEDVAQLLQDTRPDRVLSQDGATYIRSETPSLPLVRYLDGQLALSESCAVRVGNKLNRRVPPAYVNGQPVGFC